MASSKLTGLRNLRHVQPLVSLDKSEARARVIGLYKAWHREIPHIHVAYSIPKTKDECRHKVKELFMKNKDVKDIRVIDMLVVKGQQELQDTIKIHKQKHGLMFFWRETAETTKPQDFMGKFLDGH